MNNVLGWVQLDGSWGNLFPYPLSSSPQGLLTDQKVVEQMAEPAGMGFCDLGGCMYIGTLSERKDKQARSTSKANPPSLMRNATQSDPPDNARKPRVPTAAANGVGILTGAKLKEFAEHRRTSAKGNGRPTGGTPACTCMKIKSQMDDSEKKSLFDEIKRCIAQNYLIGSMRYDSTEENVSRNN